MPLMVPGIAALLDTLPNFLRESKKMSKATRSTRTGFHAEDSSDDNREEDLRDIGTDDSVTSSHDSDKEFEVEEILAQRTVEGSGKQYFIKWKGYLPHRNEWVSAAAAKHAPVPLRRWRRINSEIEAGDREPFDEAAWERAVKRRARRRREWREQRRREKQKAAAKILHSPSFDDSEDDEPIIRFKRQKTDPVVADAESVLDELFITSPTTPPLVSHALPSTATSTSSSPAKSPAPNAKDGIVAAKELSLAAINPELSAQSPVAAWDSSLAKPPANSVKESPEQSRAITPGSSKPAKQSIGLANDSPMKIKNILTDSPMKWPVTAKDTPRPVKHPFGLVNDSPTKLKSTGTASPKKSPAVAKNTSKPAEQPVGFANDSPSKLQNPLTDTSKAKLPAEPAASSSASLPVKPANGMFASVPKKLPNDINVSQGSKLVVKSPPARSSVLPTKPINDDTKNDPKQPRSHMNDIVRPKQTAKPVGGAPLVSSRRKSAGNTGFTMVSEEKTKKRKAEPQLQPFVSLRHENNVAKRAAAERQKPPPAGAVPTFNPGLIGRTLASISDPGPATAGPVLPAQPQLQINTQVSMPAMAAPQNVHTTSSVQSYNQHSQPPGFIPLSCPYWNERMECPSGTSCFFKHAPCDEIATYGLFRQAMDESQRRGSFEFKFGFFRPLVICQWWLRRPGCERTTESCWHAHWRPDLPNNTAHFTFSKPDMTCYFWAHGRCLKPAEECKYKHEVTGTIAPPPPGIPPISPSFLIPEMAHLIRGNTHAATQPSAAVHHSPTSAESSTTRSPHDYESMDYQMESTTPQTELNHHPDWGVSTNPISTRRPSYPQYTSLAIELHWGRNNHIRCMVTVPVDIEAIFKQAGASFRLQQTVSAPEFLRKFTSRASGKLFGKTGNEEQLEQLLNWLKFQHEGIVVALQSSSTDILLVPGGQVCWNFLGPVPGGAQDSDFLFYVTQRGIVPTATGSLPALSGPETIPQSIPISTLLAGPASAPSPPTNPLPGSAPAPPLVSHATNSGPSLKIQQKDQPIEMLLPKSFGAPESFFLGYKQELPKLVYIQNGEGSAEGSPEAQERQQLKRYFESIGAAVILDWKTFQAIPKGIVIISPAVHISVVSTLEGMDKILRGPHNIFHMGRDKNGTFVCEKIFPGGSLYFLSRSLFEQEPELAMKLLVGLSSRYQKMQSRSWKVFVPKPLFQLVVQYCNPGTPGCALSFEHYQTLIQTVFELDKANEAHPRDLLVLLPADPRDSSSTRDDLHDFMFKTFELYRSSRRFIAVCPPAELASAEMVELRKEFQHVQFPTSADAAMRPFRGA